MLTTHAQPIESRCRVCGYESVRARCPKCGRSRDLRPAAAFEPGSAVMTPYGQGTIRHVFPRSKFGPKSACYSVMVPYQYRSTSTTGVVGQGRVVLLYGHELETVH